MIVCVSVLGRGREGGFPDYIEEIKIEYIVLNNVLWFSSDELSNPSVLRIAPTLHHNELSTFNIP